jgi:hypothetical protein
MYVQIAAAAIAQSWKVYLVVVLACVVLFLIVTDSTAAFSLEITGLKLSRYTPNMLTAHWKSDPYSTMECMARWTVVPLLLTTEAFGRGQTASLWQSFQNQHSWRQISRSPTQLLSK